MSAGDERPALRVGETYTEEELRAAFPGAAFVGFEDDDLGTCESCDQPAVTEVYNGMHHLPVCDEHWKADECIHTEALYEFNLEVIRAGRGGEPYRWLHDWMDPNQLLCDLYEKEWVQRGMPTPEGDAYIAWMNRASELYDEWFATPGLPTFRPTEPVAGVDYEPAGCPVCGGTSSPFEHVDCLEQLGEYPHNERYGEE